MQEINNNTDRDLSSLQNILTSFLPYAKERLGYDKPCCVNFVSDIENSKKDFGKTAYYDPSNMEIVIYVDGRHPKDMLRSISHELVHHAQNCRGDFDFQFETKPGYAQNNQKLRELEAEAYLLGNGFLVRDFEDSIKLGDQVLMEWKNKEKKKLLKEAKTEKYNDAPELEGKQATELPDHLQKAIIDKDKDAGGKKDEKEDEKENVKEHYITRSEIVGNELMKRWFSKK